MLSCLSCSCTWVAVGFLAIVAGIAYGFAEKIAAWEPRGKRILITGGSSGIGLATAILLARQGAAAIVIMARDQKKIDEAIPQIQKANPATKVSGISADVSVQAPVQAACEKAIKSMGGIDAVICSAGASHPSLFVSTSESEFERLMQVNYTGIVYVLKTVVPHLIRNGPARGGRIMLVSSMAGLSGVAGYTAYGASKFALRGLAESLHMELAIPHGIAVSVANPPDVNTPMLAKENEFKPKECRLISEGSGVFEAQAIAADIVGAMRSWKFMVNTGLDGKMLAIIAGGTQPAHSGAMGLIEFFSAGLLRVVSLVYRWHYNRVVAGVHRERVAGKLDDAAAQAFHAINKVKA